MNRREYSSWATRSCRLPGWLLRGACLGVLALALFAFNAAPAAAQNTINPQTTCFGPNGPASCGIPNNGNLQDLAVDCTAGGRIDTALATIQDRDGPNRIRVSGTCTAGVQVNGFDRLVIVGSPTATFTGNWFVNNSRSITFQSVTFDFGNTTNNLLLNGAGVTFSGVIVQNSANTAAVSLAQNIGGGVSVAGSTLNFPANGALSQIKNNQCIGVEVGAGSIANLANVTISNNGFGLGPPGAGCRSQRYGIKGSNGGSITIRNVIGPVDISANNSSGIYLEGTTLTTTAEDNPANLVRIHDNVGLGLANFGGRAFINGHVIFDGNNASGQDGFGPAQIFVAHGMLAIGEGVQLIGGTGPGLSALFNSVAFIGDGGPMTISGGASFGFGSVGLLVETNTIDSLTCDNTSWTPTDGQSSIGPDNNCSTTGPTVTVNAGIGLGGGGTFPLGGSVTLNNAGVLSVSTAGPLTSTGGQTPTIGVTPNVYIENGASAQPASFNVAGNGTIGGALGVTGNVAASGSVSIGIGGTPITQYVSTTLAVSVPSLKALSCQNLVQPLGAVGSATNDTVALGVPNSLMAGGLLIFQAWESAPNTITIRVCNVNPNGPQTSAASGMIRVDLFKH
jgi:hypothetical protein